VCQIVVPPPVEKERDEGRGRGKMFQGGTRFPCVEENRLGGGVGLTTGASVAKGRKNIHERKNPKVLLVQRGSVLVKKRDLKNALGKFDRIICGFPREKKTCLRNFDHVTFGG